MDERIEAVQRMQEGIGYAAEERFLGKLIMLFGYDGRQNIHAIADGSIWRSTDHDGGCDVYGQILLSA